MKHKSSLFATLPNILLMYRFFSQSQGHCVRSDLVWPALSLGVPRVELSMIDERISPEASGTLSFLQYEIDFLDSEWRSRLRILSCKHLSVSCQRNYGSHRSLELLK